MAPLSLYFSLWAIFCYAIFSRASLNNLAIATFWANAKCGENPTLLCRSVSVGEFAFNPFLVKKTYFKC